MDVAVHAHKHFLNQVLGAFPVASGWVDEIQETILVSVDQFVESALLTLEEGAHHSAIVELAKAFSRSRTRRYFNRTKCCVSHDPLHVGDHHPPLFFPCIAISCWNTC